MNIMAQSLTYQADIKPILEKHCVSCHQYGEVGAMPLTTYDEVVAYAQMIRYVTTSGLMPPWYADPAYRHFSNERVLSQAEIQKIEAWVNTDLAEGTAPEETATKVPYTQEMDTHRKFDLEVSMSEAFEQYGIYLDQYQVFILPTHLAEDTWIEGIEFVPGNKKIVRFASISVEHTDRFDSLDRWDPRYGYYSFGGLGITPDEALWYSWSPHQKASFYSSGRAKFLQKESNLIVHIHYGPTGRPQTDSSSIRLYFSKGKGIRPIHTVPLINPYVLTGDSLSIPPDTKKIFHAVYTVPYDLEITSMTPQANLLCRSWEVYAKLPGQPGPIRLLKINDWNFNWKQTFYFEQPLTLPRGTEIHALARYDNTLDNPCNPSDKPVRFGWGAHLFSEMFFVYFEYTSAEKESSGARLDMAPLVSDNHLQALITLNKKYVCKIQICGSSTGDCTLIAEGRYAKGSHPLNLPMTSFPNGNYILRVIDKTEKILAEQVFVKMRETGL